ncbi:Aste57867_15283 [Aphanomyces stellatus]|uniref:Aste57867_15283 protein n=1 Tax=Aphanomyces stellatus TaxID=120398 RepID=A0A485L435_9STRA|nr:hypothetical protein As57867_015227 [Aphanomyces stellatus]VFT92092.1 Aste57867_15283 [Aphanomyces stellatus]
MSGRPSVREQVSFHTPRADGTPQHAGPPAPMHTPIQINDTGDEKFRPMDDVVILSGDKSDDSFRSKTLDTMKSFFRRHSKTRDALLTKFNFFRSSRTEESYQLDVNQQSIGHSQLVLVILMVSRVAVTVWWYNTKSTPSLVGLEEIADNYEDPYHWAFFPFGFVLAVLPFRCINTWGKTKLFAYAMRRYWKHCITLVLVLFSVGYLFYYAGVYRDTKSSFKDAFAATACGKDVDTLAQYEVKLKGNNTTPTLDVAVISFTGGLMDCMYNMFVINAIATAIVLCLTLKLDFPQALVVLGSSFVFYIVDWTMNNEGNLIYATTKYYVFAFAIIVPMLSGLTAFYFIDRDARMAFFAKVDAERVNTALKHGVTVNRLKYQTRGRVGPFEEQLLQELLVKSPENALIHNVSIPFDDLTLHELLTEHAKGDVVRGEYTGLRVAIKRLSVLTRETVVEFKTHVELLACLRHPNVVQFIGASFDSLTNLCVVMEYMEKGNVYNLLRTSMVLEWNDPLLQIAIDAAQGIAYLHHSNVIHRDLKCENLLCTATYACKVSDFGESKQVQTQEVLETMVGTPYWLAPEILRETPYHNKVDCYSFGIVLIELESRRDPYFDCEDMSTIDIMMQVAMGTLRPTIPASCPPRRRALIEQCLSDNPMDRPSMVTILKTLQTAVRDEVLASRINVSDPQQNRRQLLQKHQMLNRRGLHEVLATDQDE